MCSLARIDLLLVGLGERKQAGRVGTKVVVDQQNDQVLLGAHHIVKVGH